MTEVYQAREEWTDNVLASYRYSIDVVQASLPDGLTVIPFEGFAIVSVWFFYQENVLMHPNIMPRFLGKLGAAPDLHLQTYVSHEDGREGLFCYKMWMGKSLPCWFGRKFFDAPMYAGDQTTTRTEHHTEHTCIYRENKKSKIEEAAIRYKVGEIVAGDENSLDEFTVNKYANRQFTYFQNHLNSIPNHSNRKEIYSVDILHFKSNVAQLLLGEPEPTFEVHFRAFSNVLCNVLPSEVNK